MLVILAKLLAACSAGWLHALYGSGKFHGTWKNKVLEWVVIPVFMFAAISCFTHNLWLPALYVICTYLWKMATGTGGDQQAYYLNTINDPHECEGLDQIAEYLANTTVDSNFWDDSSTFVNRWHRLWGFWFATLSAIIFTIPWIFTNYFFALPVLLYGFACREWTRRQVEFRCTAIMLFLFLLSL